MALARPQMLLPATLVGYVVSQHIPRLRTANKSALPYSPKYFDHQNQEYCHAAVRVLKFDPVLAVVPALQASLKDC